jgi:hypothetical protein
MRPIIDYLIPCNEASVLFDRGIQSAHINFCTSRFIRILTLLYVCSVNRLGLAKLVQRAFCQYHKHSQAVPYAEHPACQRG